MSCDYGAVNVYKNNNITRTFTNIPIKWSFSCEFPKENQKVVLDAFDYWQQFVNYKLFEKVDKCGVADFLVRNKTGGIGVVFSKDQIYHKRSEECNDLKDKECLPIYGRAPSSTVDGRMFAGLIELFPNWKRIDIDLQNSVVRHEIGHLLGFDHSLWMNCLMYETIHDFYRKKDLCNQEIKMFKELYKENK